MISGGYREVAAFFMEHYMPHLKYIAATVKTDSINGVGLNWQPGQVRNVTAEVAERLLVFTDTWQIADEANGSNERIGLAEQSQAAEEPLPVIDFHAMDKNTLIEYAERHYNERLGKRQSEEAVRHKVIALFSRHEMAE
ncbi:hypothetical protein [Nitrosospira sp. Nsp11]|uniref:hypothetical protein n=1 Tax=Nitrosospira sp. Nsp11 TaxID=1855338 RepID=UPI000AF60BC2|nr:hypothetical protein [Nitrosospira sp. Nsp11]